MKNPELKVDDRVIILDMSDAQAVEPGTWGTVTSVTEEFGPLQYGVNWDDGSTLRLIPELDKWDTNQNRIENGKRPLKGE
jgi:hypothetical protein